MQLINRNTILTNCYYLFFYGKDKHAILVIILLVLILEHKFHSLDGPDSDRGVYTRKWLGWFIHIYNKKTGKTRRSDTNFDN